MVHVVMRQQDGVDVSREITLAKVRLPSIDQNTKAVDFEYGAAGTSLVTALLPRPFTGATMASPDWNGTGIASADEFEPTAHDRSDIAVE
ncbi:hypothetical protein GCM10022278_27350 [Allohahella marinimesophila]|uniref:Uncharacterized protein n=1 Tax=Allohahella marinimesophila TaxID=1054972 RepID=A0ABP7PMI5_9GAMM